MTLKCIIVEDAAFLREVYRYNLKDQPIEIIDEAADGMDAMIKINKHKPDLIILDLVLPMKSGLDVLKEISRISPNSKCVVISAIDDPEIIRKALALGAISYLAKPFNKAELVNCIEEVTRTYSEVYNG